MAARSNLDLTIEMHILRTKSCGEEVNLSQSETSLPCSLTVNSGLVPSWPASLACFAPIEVLILDKTIPRDVLYFRETGSLDTLSSSDTVTHCL